MNKPVSISPSSPAAADRIRACVERTLRTEIRGLEDIIARLDARLIAAIAALAATRGRIIVTGMGKSGHVARKMAATFASTGTPAFFVHPAEASHGDMGMITEADAVIALSRGGASAELADLIQYTRRFHIPLIAMTCRADSPLALAADHVVLVPDSEEACPLGMAPTTSTTQMLALGDAMAVALMELKGFEPEQFRVLHPGGKLGAKLRRVEELMHRGAALPLVGPNVPMAEAILVFTAKNLGAVGVIDGAGALLGIITDGDLKRHMGPDFLGKTTAEIMTRSPKTIRPQALAEEALHLMNEKSITNLFVLDEAGKPLGIIHIHDILRAGIM